MVKLLWIFMALWVATPVSAGTLPIEPVIQQTPVWCWAAVSEMTFRYRGIPTINPVGDYQCGIVAGMAPGCAVDCRRCQVPAGNLDYMTGVLLGYPALASQVTSTPARMLAAEPVYRPLTPDEVRAEIDADRPIVAGITPGGIPAGFNPAHVALIIGYEDTPQGMVLFVNDPYPYLIGPLGPYGDPFLKLGARTNGRGGYMIMYEQFKSGLSWTQSIRGLGPRH